MSFVAAAIGVGGAILGASISASGAESAAQTQAAALGRSADIQKSMFDQTTANESPFLGAGIGATSQLNYLLGMGTPGTGRTPDGAGTAASSTAGGFGSLLSPFTTDTFKTMSPAYQFELQQGGQGTLNQDSSSQGAMSGAALKDLMSFNQNHANTSFSNAFNQYQTQQNNVFGRLNSLATLGQGAASNQATGASSFANSIGNSTAAQGAALGAGQVGAANAWSGGLQSAAPWLQAGFSKPAGGDPNYGLDPAVATPNAQYMTEPQY